MLIKDEESQSCTHSMSHLVSLMNDFFLPPPAMELLNCQLFIYLFFLTRQK